MEQEADFQGSVSCEAVWLHVGVVGERGGKRISLTFWDLLSPLLGGALSFASSSKERVTKGQD